MTGFLYVDERLSLISVGDRLAEWLRRLTWVQKVPGSIPGSNVLWSCQNLLRGAKVTVEAQVLKANRRFLFVIV